MSGCGHPLCELIGAGCSIATHRSRGCRPGAFAPGVAPALFAEVRALVATIHARAGADADTDADTDADADSDADAARAAAARAAAARLAQIVRREAMEERNLLAHARDDEPELAEALAPLLVRRSTT